MSEDAEGGEHQEVEQPPLLGAPRAPLPELITNVEALAIAIDQLSRGEGDIALDAERASGYRYSQRAYLIQIFRRNGGLHLIDPAAFAQEELRQIFAPLNTIIIKRYFGNSCQLARSTLFT